jgi:hypothetical protein
METSGTTPDVGIAAPDLAEVMRGDGPFLTVYLTTESQIDNAGHRSEQRWRTLRDELAQRGAPEAALAAIDELVPDAHHSGECLGVIATSSGIKHVEHGPVAPARDWGRWDALPAVLPILEWRQSAPPYVVVTTDRTGADIVAYRHESPDITRQAGSGDVPHLKKVQAGGWSHRRFQERAENNWEANADEVAKVLTRLVEQVDARTVLVAGDERAVQLLQESLAPEIVELIEVIDGGRGQDGSEPAESDDARRLVNTAVARDTVAILDKLKEELGQHDRAASGVDATLAALQMAQVHVLLVADDLEDDRTIWFGEDPSQLGRSADDVSGLGAQKPQQGRLVDAFVRSALCSSASVRIVAKSAIDDGVAAVLRWSAS